MLDFQEVQRRILQRHCDCGTCSPDDVPHCAVVEPIIDQLRDELNETLLLTPKERNLLAGMLDRQSKMLDRQSKMLDSQSSIIDSQSKMLDSQSSIIDSLTRLDELHASLQRHVVRGLIVVALAICAVALLAIGHWL